MIVYWSRLTKTDVIMSLSKAIERFGVTCGHASLERGYFFVWATAQTKKYPYDRRAALDGEA